MTTINPVVIDISHYNDVSDWDAVQKFGILGVINKATEGSTVVDKTYAIRRGPCLARGLLYGAYHFIRPGDPEAQADHFLDVVQPTASTLLALDYEDPRVKVNAARKFLAHIIKNTGRKAVFYLGGACRDQVLPQDAFLAGHKLWHPQYGPRARIPKPWTEYWLWQYTGDNLGPKPHDVPGVVIPGKKGIDINTYDGTAEQLTKEWAE